MYFLNEWLKWHAVSTVGQRYQSYIGIVDMKNFTDLMSYFFFIIKWLKSTDAFQHSYVIKMFISWSEYLTFSVVHDW